MKFTILVIDDEENIRNGLAANFEMEDYNVKTAPNGKEGIALIDKGDIDLVITDLRMDGISGEEVVRHIATETPGIPVIVLTGHGSIDSAVKAMRDGAYDFLTKPLNLDQLNMIVKRALESRELSLQHKMLKQEVEENHNKIMIGSSLQMKKLYELIKKVAPSKASVLVTGETGVGKELVAREIHNNSPRRDKEMIVVNCSALSESLLESELFGHEKGAFTGADYLKKGRFELAHKSTIFLDEIGEINASTQVKLLRVLQEKKFERVGGQETIEVDVRVIAATNRNLEEEVKAGRFREDLYYRLDVVHLEIPPLRERKEDIPELIEYFLKKYSENGNLSIEQKAKISLFKYDWPGNIRQLEHCIESAAVLCTDNVIREENLPPEIVKAAGKTDISIPVGITLEEAEKIIIEQNLAANNGNKSKTAEILGIERKTLANKLQ